MTSCPVYWYIGQVIIMVGYSKRSLRDKLGIKPGSNISVLNAPKDYEKTLEFTFNTKCR